MIGLTPLQVRSTDHFVGDLLVRQVRLIEGALHPVPILMVHGRCHGAWAYERWLSSFGHAGWDAFAMSLRGHRGSRPLSSDALLTTTFEEFLDDILAVITWLGRPPVLLGHSLGGILVQKVAELFHAEGLVLVASVGPSQLGRHSDDFPVDQLVDDRPVYEGKGQLDIARLVGPESPIALNAVRGRTPIDGSRISCPILVVEAENDDTGVHDPRTVAAFYGADHVVILGATHDVMFDPTSALAASMIQAWLRDRLVPPPWSRVATAS